MGVNTRILVTGFTPFPTAPENPTEVLAGAIQADQIDLPEKIEGRAVLLPTEYEASLEKLKSEIGNFKPDAVVSFGLSAKAQGFTLERVARNEWSSELPDNGGFRPSDPQILPEGEATCPSTLPLKEMFVDLKDLDLPVAYSDDAGAYVCNHLFYRTMSMDKASRPSQAGFVHVPYLSEQRDRLEKEGRIENGLFALNQEDLFRGVAAILKRVASHT
jgi:pyroglutamyl-peptidase